MNKMNRIVIAVMTALVLGFNGQVFAQFSQIESRVYEWSDMTIEGNAQYSSVEMFSGSALGMDELTVTQYMVRNGAEPYQGVIPDTEVMIIVKEGLLDVAVEDDSDVIGPGSVVLIMAGDTFTISADGESPAAFYTMAYKTNTPPDMTRAEEGGGSMIINFDDLEFNPHDRGGQWQYMNRPTSVLGRMDIHVTSLNAGIKSHEPHTHRAPEIVLMIEKETQMEIGDGIYPGSDGDLYFLGSEVPHAIENLDDENTRYFAIQWMPAE